MDFDCRPRRTWAARSRSACDHGRCEHSLYRMPAEPDSEASRYALRGCASAVDRTRELQMIANATAQRPSDLRGGAGQRGRDSALSCVARGVAPGCGDGPNVRARSGERIFADRLGVSSKWLDMRPLAIGQPLLKRGAASQRRFMRSRCSRITQHRRSRVRLRQQHPPRSRSMKA